MAGPVGAVSGITVDVSDLARSETFWGEVLGLTVRHRHDPYVWLDEVAPGVRLILQRVDDAKTAKNRMHLDIQAPDGEALIARVRELGGREVAVVEEDEYSLTVLADPDGNEFCLLRRLSPALAEAR